MDAPTFYIRDLPINGALVLAPLSGYNDQPFRCLCREMGAALVYTGLLSASGILYGSNRTREMLRFADDLHPLVCQIFGHDEAELETAAQRISATGADVLDLNLGCAEPKVTKGGSGAALLRDPLKIGRILTRLVRAVSLPVTAKIRLGWDAASRNYLEVAHIVEESGASLLAVHGRTAEQFYSGCADWDAIAAVKQALHIPVIASGDVREIEDVSRIQQHTGCDAVMVGRAAIGNPWFFQQRARESVTPAERSAVMERHLRAMLVFHGDYHGVERFRKHLRVYLHHSGAPRPRRSAMMDCTDAAQLLDWIREIAAY